MMLVIFSNRAVWMSDSVVDGLSHRYYGLYSNMARYVINSGGCVFWYDVTRRVLFKVCSDTVICVKGISFLKTAMRSLKEAICRGNLVVVLIDYPHSFLGVKHLPEYLAVLLILHVSRLFKRTFVVIDNMDPPMEHAMELQNGRISLLQKALWSLINIIVLRYDLIVFHSTAYRVYHKLYYNIDYSRSEVTPPGSFPEKIPYINMPDEYPIRVLCSGHVTKWVGLEKLCEVSKKLADKGLRIKFMVIDRSAPLRVNNEDIEVINTYLDYREFIKMLASSHLLLLLLRPKSLHHLLTARASLADYLMSGRPVLYLHSLGIREVARGCGGALEFRDLNELLILISHIAHNISLLKDLGKECRLFAVKYLNYKKHALKLLKKVSLKYLTMLKHRDE